MHFLVSTPKGDDFRKCFSLPACQEFVREHGPGDYDVVAVSRRMGMDHESWFWGYLILGADGKLTAR